MQVGDNFVLVILIIALVIWLWFRVQSLKRNSPSMKRLDLEAEEEIPETDIVALLEEEGYEVITQKKRIPILITVNDEEELQTRLFIDHFAQNEGQLYVVKVARARKPLEMTGSAIREHLLPYQLLYKEVAGVLYVDPTLRTIHKIQFEIDVEGD